ALAFSRVRSEAEEMARALKEKADDVPNAEIEKYYKDNPSEFEQFELQRIFVSKETKPAVKDNKPEPKQESSKSSETEKDSNQESAQPAEKAKADDTKVDNDRMKELADAVHAQAVAGEDFEKLQSVEQSARTVLNVTYFPKPNSARGFGGRDSHGIKQITIPPTPPEPVAAHPATASPEAPKN